ncbi:sensor histidine kinase [Sphaerotilus microaerophilus]|uniref:histidine kinase n=1 Tax=Sphaerotilus microaerophilus TaxID=2914710 RepID=A0ABM7YS02_9BURK|nr:sensor histidine kinase [Sphaerotilus sp. FB-5]BDI07375.1 ATPase [Sphaerotilus sp. FB-5]
MKRPGLRDALLHSLRWRLLTATLVALLIALLLAGGLLAGLFRDHVLRQFGTALTAQLDQVTARLDIDAAGQPRLDPAGLSDPRWSHPYGGLYWQVDRVTAHGAPGSQRGVLRSRSLWDSELQAPADAIADGTVHLHEVAGPGGARLLLAERSVRNGSAEPSVPSPADATPANGRPVWRLMVAADLAETEQAITRFNGTLAGSLAVLLGLLCAAAVAQVAVGLAPLRSLQRALAAVHAGQSPRLVGRFPSEVQPLIDDFNAVLDLHAQRVARARTQAGDLAHAVKTPLAVLAQAATAARTEPAAAAELPALVTQQVELARRQVDRHLARARAAASPGLPGSHCAVAPLLHGLLRVMDRVHAERHLDLDGGDIAPGLAFAGDAQDLQEMLGNLLDNACKWARTGVAVRASLEPGPAGARLRLQVDDDGPGIPPERRAEVMARGARLDESVPGSGLGLAIVQELAQLYGGQLTLAPSPSGGLRVTLDLPGARA